MDSPSIKYIRSLDGYRAFAVIFILLLHSNLYVFKALWIGVPMFFTLSGFLVTTILLVNKDKKNYFRVFYFRRTLRIFPIYYLLLFSCIVFAFISHANISQWYYYLFYLQNFSISLNIGPVFCNEILKHTWSLSVEELFYLVWPIIVFVSNVKALYYLAGSLLLSSVLFKLICVISFYSSVTEGITLLSIFGNIDSLMAGALLSLLLQGRLNFFTKKLKFIKTTFIFVFFTTIILSALSFCSCFETNYLQIFLKVLVSINLILFSFFLILILTTKIIAKSLISNLFENRVVVFIGKISYGIYLYHYAVYQIFESLLYHYKISINLLQALPIKIVLTLVVSIVSWYLIEKPILGLKNKISYIT